MVWRIIFGIPLSDEPFWVGLPPKDAGRKIPWAHDPDFNGYIE